MGFGCGSVKGFDTGVEAPLSLNPLASITGRAADLFQAKQGWTPLGSGLPY